MRNKRTLRHILLRRIVPVGAILLVLAALLMLDLLNHGLAWRVFWSLTGEESLAGQIRGMIELGGNLIRVAPQTDPYAPVAHAGVNPYGINTFLEQEVEPEKRERQLQMISEAGFTWIRQQFPWEDIEIHGRGDFIDRRNDPAGVDAWAKYDNIVELAEQYGVQIQARLDNPPAWTHADPNIGAFAPPDDVQDFVNYAVAVAERYQGRIHTYQVWNEPNIYPEWGEQNVSVVDYTDLLCRTYAALKAVDPDIVVISGALAPTVALDGRNLQDYIFLQQMYHAGAGECFDILSAQGYGLNSGPTDRRLRPTSVNFNRHLYLRDVMVANGDADKAIWISEAAWNPVDEPDVSRDIVGYYNYGTATLDQAARFMPLAYERANREMPWIGVVNYWFFKRASDAERNQAFYYFRMVEPDFTPLPVYDSMKIHIATETPTLFPGAHQADHWAIFPDEAQIVAANGAQFDTASEMTAVEFTVNGTGIVVRWQGDSPLTILNEANEPLATLNPPEPEPESETTEEPAETEFIENEPDLWTENYIHLAQFAEPQSLRIVAMDDEPFLLDSITVIDRGVTQLIPTIAGVAGVVLVALGIIGSAIWKRFK